MSRVSGAATRRLRPVSDTDSVMPQRWGLNRRPHYRASPRDGARVFPLGGRLDACDYLAVGAVGGVVAALGFIWWQVLIALLLFLTPAGRLVSRRWRWLAGGTVVCGTLWFAAGLVDSRPRLDPPLNGLVNPLGVARLDG